MYIIPLLDDALTLLNLLSVVLTDCMTLFYLILASSSHQQHLLMSTTQQKNNKHNNLSEPFPDPIKFIKPLHCYIA